MASTPTDSKTTTGDSETVVAPSRPTPASFGVRHPVPANLLMWAIIVAGLIFGLSLRREMFPEIRADRALIVAPYPGASPKEIEESVVKKIEDRIADLDEVDEISATIVEGVGTVIVTFQRAVEDLDQAVDEVESAIEQIQDLPDDLERIRVSKFEPTLPVIALSLYGDADERDLKRAARRLEDDLESLPGMGEIILSGVRNDEIRVEVSPETLMRYGLSLPVISDQVTEEMRESPGGALRTGVETVRVRTMGAEERAEAIRDIVIKSDPSGAVVRLDEVADILDGFEDVVVRQRINNRPAVRLTITNENDGDAIKIANLVRSYVAGRTGQPFEPFWNDRWNAALNLFTPPGPSGEPTRVSPRLTAYNLGVARSGDPLPGELVLHNDLAQYIEGRLDLLTRNAKYGAVLVFATLLLFLNLQVAGWVMLGLVISLLGTLAFMAMLGITLNLLTMFGLIIVLGLLVDDAIVVAENIVARHERGEPALVAAVNGAGQIGWPVIATVTSTIAAFIPLGLVEGQIGDFLGALPIVVACALAVSVVEALIILPAHMGHSLAKAERGARTRIGAWFVRLEARRDALINDRIVPAFGRLLEIILHFRYIAAAVALATLIISFGLVGGGRVEFTFFSETDSEILIIDLRMPVGTPAERTNALIGRLEAIALEQPEVQTVEGLVGIRLDTDDFSASEPQSHIGQVYIELAPVEERERTSGEVKAAMRESIGELSGISALRIMEVQGGPGGELEIVITGPTEEKLVLASEMLKSKLASYEGVEDIRDDIESGQRELQITLLDGAKGLGFTTSSIARQIRAAVYGLEAHTFAGDEEDVDVRITLDESSRRQLSSIEKLYVFTPAGQWVPLSEVARIDEASGYATIHRFERQRAVTISADVNQKLNNPERIASELTPYFSEIERAAPGVRVEPRGRQMETAKSLSSLRVGFLLALGLIYVVLAWLFGHYFQPIVVMLSIPFATIGMIWGHYLLDYKIMILSLIGFVALTGIVVNDSLIYMEFYNQMREKGWAMRDALVEAGRRRLRPILLTTMTTVLGLLPLMLEQSFQARILIPMAISISCGLISATVLILVVLPCLTLIGNDLRAIALFLWNGRWPEIGIGGLLSADAPPREPDPS
ncbi:MAG: efflux RND transporter permease subunit [Phycisphaerales bacterium]